MSNKKKYGFRIDGCHDSTYFEMELTDCEAKVALLISEMSEKASTYQCQPIMEFFEVEENKHEWYP